MDDDAQRSLLLWVQSFADSIPAARSVTSLEDLCDGVVLSKLMHQIDAEYVNMEILSEHVASDNWALKASNVKTLLRSVELYYHEELGQLVDANDLVDVQRVAKDSDVLEIAKLTELVLGCAVQCPDRSEYIQPILEMDATVQASLMGVIESVMHRFQLVSPTNSTSTTASAAAAATTFTAADAAHHESSFARGARHDATRSRDSFSYLSPLDANASDPTSLVAALEKVATLERRVVDMERSKRELTDRFEDALRDQQRVTTTLTTLTNERDALLAERQSTLTRDNKKLKDLVDGELHALTQALDAKSDELVRVKREANERLAVLEHEVRRQADELDIARSKLSTFAKLEASVTKYKRKLEEMTALRATVSDLEMHNAQYLDKVLDLESTLKTLPTLKAMVERYKNQVVDLETANVEAVAANQVKDQRVRRLQEELESAMSGHEFLASQLDDVRSQLAQAEQQTTTDKQRSDSTGDSADAIVSRESSSALRERVARLERENATLRAAASGDEDATTAAQYANELDVAQRAKEALQFALLELKQQHAELQEQLRVAQQPASAARAASGNAVASSSHDASTSDASFEPAAAAGTTDSSVTVAAARRSVTGIPGLAPAPGALGAVTDASTSPLFASGNSNASLSQAALVGGETTLSGVTAAQVAVYEEKIEKLQADAEVADSMRVAVAELTHRLKDKESVINELSEQRAKLENYTKKTLHAVQTKYMVAVSSHRNQLLEKQERVEVLETKLKEMRTSYSREQALMMSSFYEIGTEMQRRTMLPQSQATGSQSGGGAGSWLASKRTEERAKRRNV